MRMLTCGLLAMLCLATFPAALRADDAQTLFDEIRAGVQNPRLQAATPEEAQKAVVAHMDGVLAKCETYRKQFPTGAQFAEVCLIQADVLFFLATRVPGQTDRVEKIPEAANAAIAVDPKGEQAVKGRLALLRYQLTKQAMAKTPEEGAPFLAAAVGEGEGIARDFPKSPTIPMVLDFLAGAYDRTGRQKEATETLERIVKEFGGTQAAQKAERMIKQRAFKGAVLELAFKSVAGDEVDLKNLRGKVVLVDFWASWCKPCEASMPKLVEVEKLYRDQGFRVIGISLDQDKGAMENFMKKYEMTWPQYFDGMVWNSPMVGKYAIIGIPTTFLIDKKGVLREISPEGPKLADAVKKLLDEPAAP